MDARDLIARNERKMNLAVAATGLYLPYDNVQARVGGITHWAPNPELSY
jgi:hypothetical protein